MKELEGVLTGAPFNLPDIDRVVFSEFRLNETPPTIAKLAERLDLSVEKVRQIESRAVEKIREAMIVVDSQDPERQQNAQGRIRQILSEVLAKDRNDLLFRRGRVGFFGLAPSVIDDSAVIRRIAKTREDETRNAASKAEYRKRAIAAGLTWARADSRTTHYPLPLPRPGALGA